MWIFSGTTHLDFGDKLSMLDRLSLRAAGRGFFLATMRVSLGYFHGKQKEIEPKVLPSCPIPLLQIAYTRQLETLTTT